MKDPARATYTAYLVGHYYSREGVAFKCTTAGTAEEFETIADAQSQADTMNSHDPERNSPEPIWRVFALVELKS